MKKYIYTFLFLLLVNDSSAVCCKNEITEEDVAWEYGKREQEYGECSCQYGQFRRTGTLYVFWEPVRIMETVKDPGCMLTEGEYDGDIAALISHGTTHDTGSMDAQMAFQQVHITLPDYIRESIVQNDIRCWHVGTGIDEDYISEEDSAWNNEAVAMVNYPLTEASAQFSNVLACVADAASSQFGFPLDPYYWCMGAWGNTYPINGHSGTNEYLTANANVAGRGIYLGGRTGRILDTASYYCYPGPMLVWIKSYFNLQPVRPHVRRRMIPIGQTPLVWEHGLNASECLDNFAWVVWRKRSCCDSTNGAINDSGTGSVVDLPSMETSLGDSFKDLGAAELIGMFGAAIISLVADEFGNVSEILVDGSEYMDILTGLAEGTGEIDLGFLGSFNVSEAMGQGFMSPTMPSTIPGVDEIPGFDSVPGMDEIPDVDFLNNLIPGLDEVPFDEFIDGLIDFP